MGAESGGFCEARRDGCGARTAWGRVTEAGLSEAAVGPALWVEYGAAVGGPLIAGGGLGGLGAVGGDDPSFDTRGTAGQMPLGMAGGSGIGSRWSLGVGFGHSHPGARGGHGRGWRDVYQGWPGHHGGAGGGARGRTDRISAMLPQHRQVSGSGARWPGGAQR